MRNVCGIMAGVVLATGFSGAGIAAEVDLVNQDQLYMMNAVTGGTGVVYNPTANLQGGFGANDVFMRLNVASGSQAGAGPQQGYNTTGTNQFASTSSFLTALPLNSIPVVNISGTEYIEIALGFNMNGLPGNNPGFSSLDEFQLFQGATSNLTGYDPVGGGPNAATLAGAAPVFDWFGNVADDYATLYDYHPGQSALDYLFYIPASLFTQDFVYLYADMGVTRDQNDGDDRWAREFGGDGFCVDLGGIDCDPSTPPVPEPGTLALFAATWLAFRGTRRRFRFM